MSVDICNLLHRELRRRASVAGAGSQPAVKIPLHYGRREGQQTYTRWIRWPVPAGLEPTPTSVEVVGSFTDWHRLPLVYDPATRSWNAAVQDIVANRTHRYVILVDGKPSYDSTCDGLTLPQEQEERRYQIQTGKGPRVMLMFGQTK